MSAATMDRRGFLVTLSGAAGAVTAATWLPSLAFATPAPVVAAVVEDPLIDVDYTTGHWPPYSHPIPYGRGDIAAAGRDLVDGSFDYQLLQV